MATNGTLIIHGEGEQAVFQLNQTTAAAGTVSTTLETKNTFLDKNIEVNIQTPAAGNLSLDVTDSSTALTMGEADEGYYYPTANIEGTASVATAGWVDTTGISVSENAVQVGKVVQSTLKNGNTAISSGSNVVPLCTDDQTINITEGYNTARTVVVKSMADGQAATVNSSNATVSSLTFTADNGSFAVTGSETINAPTVSQQGYISSTVGTKNTGTASVAATVDQVTVGVDVTGTAKVTPAISRAAAEVGDTYIEAGTGTATTTKPSAGAYVRVKSAAATSNISSTGKVTAAGYGTTTDFTAATATTTEVGANASADTYVEIGAGAVTSGSAEIGSVSVAYDSEGGNFNVTGSANIPAPTVGTAGYVGNGIGTLSGATGGATVDAILAKIAIGTEISGTATYKPVIAKNPATNVASETATTSQPASGYYVAVQTSANTGTLTATPSVTAAGYGDATHFTAATDTETVGAEASDLTYIPLAAASLANAETSGQTYTDISSTGPVLISGSYLFINKGYIENSKISLARLVPDSASQNLAADKMLDGFSAYNNDGTLITGTIPTYAGAYTIA